MFKAIVRWFIRHFIVPHIDLIDRKAKCPACGIVRKHKIAFSEKHGAIVHNCEQCGALWGQAPMVSWNAWKVNMDPISQNKPVTGKIMDMPAIVRQAKS